MAQTLGIVSHIPWFQTPSHCYKPMQLTRGRYRWCCSLSRAAPALTAQAQSVPWAACTTPNRWGTLARLSQQCTVTPETSPWGKSRLLQQPLLPHLPLQMLSNPTALLKHQRGKVFVCLFVVFKSSLHDNGECCSRT